MNNPPEQNLIGSKLRVAIVHHVSQVQVDMLTASGGDILDAEDEAVVEHAVEAILKGITSIIEKAQPDHVVPNTMSHRTDIQVAKAIAEADGHNRAIDKYKDSLMREIGK